MRKALVWCLYAATLSVCGAELPKMEAGYPVAYTEIAYTSTCPKCRKDDNKKVDTIVKWVSTATALSKTGMADIVYDRHKDNKGVTPFSTRWVTYCDFVCEVEGQSDACKTCETGCNWWKNYNIHINPHSARKACLTNSCDAMPAPDRRKQIQGCTEIAKWSTISPVLNRASGLDQPDMCKCDGECSERDGYNWKWCYVKPQHSFCPMAMETESGKKYNNPRWTTAKSGWFDMDQLMWKGFSTLHSQCGQQETVTERQERDIRSWELGRSNYEDVTYYSPGNVWADYRTKAFYVRYKKFTGERYGWDDSKDDEDTSGTKWAVNTIQYYKIFEHKTDFCPADTPKVEIMRNAFSMQVPPCYDVQSDENGAQTMGCISYQWWRDFTTRQMSGAHEGKERLVSTKYVRVTKAKDTTITLFRDRECNSPAPTVQCQDTSGPTHDTCVLEADVGTDLLEYSWRISPTETGQCLTRNTEAQCTTEGHAVPADHVGGAKYRFTCVAATGITQEMKLVRDDCLQSSYYQWLNCDAHHFADATNLKKPCSRCPPHQPSRPKIIGTANVCVPCVKGMYFDLNRDDCVFIPRLLWNADTSPGKWKIKDSKSGAPTTSQIRDLTELDSRFGAYVLAADQTDLKYLEETQYFDEVAGFPRLCRNSVDNAAYRFLDSCGGLSVGPLPASSTEITAGDEETKIRFEKASRLYLHDANSIMLNVATVASGEYGVKWMGVHVQCNACVKGTYHKHCWAGEAALLPASCINCDNTCPSTDGQTTQYLWHRIKYKGCNDPHAVTPTVCRECLPLNITDVGTDEAVYSIVVGCGYHSTPRWPRVAMTAVSDSCPVVENLPDGMHTYNTDNNNCRNRERQMFKHGNDYRGLTHLGPPTIPYCPPGHYVDLDKCTDITASAAWSPLCCTQCGRCPSHQMKKESWKQCLGNGTIDIQINECTEKCSTGYYKFVGTSNDMPTAFDDETTEERACVRCRTAC